MNGTHAIRKSRLKAQGRVMLLGGYGVKLSLYRERKAKRQKLAHRLMREVLAELKGKAISDGE